MSDFFWFSDAQWARIGPLLPTDTRGMARVDDRRVLSGIVHALRNGGRWADCPREVYGPKKTLYNRFVRWAERGIWERIFSALAGGEDAPDRLFKKTHQGSRCAGGNALCNAGRSAASAPGNGYSARWRAAKTPPTGCSSIQPASRFIAAPAAEKGGLGPWHRPHQGGPQHQAPRCLRCERQAPRPAPDTRKRP